MKQELEKEYKESLKEIAFQLNRLVEEEMINDEIIADRCRSFLWEYANKLIDKNGEPFYIQTLSELLLFEGVLSPTENAFNHNDFLNRFFSEAIVRLNAKAGIKKLVNEAKVFYKSILDKNSDFQSYLHKTLEYTFSPHWYPSSAFRQETNDQLPSVLESLLSEFIRVEESDCRIDPFSNHLNFANQLAIQASCFKIFPNYLLGMLEKTTNIYWIDSLKEDSFINPPQMDIFSLNQIQASINDLGTKEVSLVFSDLRNLPSFITKNSSVKNSKRVKDTFLTHSFNEAKVSNGILKIVRWSIDRVKKTGSVLFIVEEAVVENQLYAGLRKSLEHEFANIYLVKIEEDKRSFYCMLLNSKH